MSMPFWKNLFQRKRTTSDEEHPPCPPQGGNGHDAASWGRHVAELVYLKCGNDLAQILSAWQWRLIIATEDQPAFLLPRFGVWEGDTKTIRIFRAPLRHAFSNLQHAQTLACAHEMFHGLVAHDYLTLLPSLYEPPRLSSNDEEIAADAFAHAIAKNFRLTLEA